MLLSREFVSCVEEEGCAGGGMFLDAAAASLLKILVCAEREEDEVVH